MRHLLDQLLRRLGLVRRTDYDELQRQLTTAQAFAKYVVERTDPDAVVIGADDTVLRGLSFCGGRVYVLPGVQRTLIADCYFSAASTAQPAAAPTRPPQP